MLLKLLTARKHTSTSLSWNLQSVPLSHMCVLAGALLWVELRLLQGQEEQLWTHLGSLQAAVDALADAGHLPASRLQILSSFAEMVELVRNSLLCWLPANKPCDSFVV